MAREKRYSIEWWIKKVEAVSTPTQANKFIASYRKWRKDNQFNETQIKALYKIKKDIEAGFSPNTDPFKEQKEKKK